mgnify:CR=1 FL=1|tara:strand:- start:515 stop:1486 length:972 start_codon:yes stop_codon:yes gene_type:complete
MNIASKSRNIKGCFKCNSKLAPFKKNSSYPIICPKCKIFNRKIITKCFYCDSKKYEKWGRPVRDFYSVKCKNCCIVYIKNPLTTEAQSNFYDNYLENVHQKNKKKNRQRSKMYQIELDFLLSAISNSKNLKSVLDVGCGGGYFLDLLKKKGIKTFGTEVGRDSYLQAKKKHKMFYGEFNQKLKINKKFDLIVMRGVIEHVENPTKYISLGQKLLKKGGYFFITATPNLDSVAAKIFKERWTLHRPEVHILHLSESHVDKLFNKKNFIKCGTKSLYLGTPYENFYQDMRKMCNEMNSQSKGKSSNNQSPPFFDSMMTVVYKKTS